MIVLSRAVFYPIYILFSLLAYLIQHIMGTDVSRRSSLVVDDPLSDKPFIVIVTEDICSQRIKPDKFFIFVHINVLQLN